jgi:hypothetical protein
MQWGNAIMCNTEGPLRIADAHTKKLGFFYAQPSYFRAFILERNQFNVQKNQFYQMNDQLHFTSKYAHYTHMQTYKSESGESSFIYCRR